jgi:hypothetical protein
VSLRILRFLILTLLLVTSATVRAEVYKRSVDFEWEPIEGAKTYELELHRKSAGSSEAKEVEKPHLYKTATAAWSGPLRPGSYTMRIRAKDRRGVPGVWSPPEEFNVGLDAVHLVRPKAGEKLSSKEDNEQKVLFRWLSVGGAERYVFELRSLDGATQIQKVLTENQFAAEIPVGRAYSWRVKAIGIEAEGAPSDLTEFSLMGKQISTPVIESPDNKYVRNIKWSAPPNADHYAFSLKRKNTKTGKWETVTLEKGYKNNELAFNPLWKGGTYKMSLKAKGNLRPSSKVAEIEFPVQDGNRSPAAEEVATTRESIDRFSGWYSIASYLISMVNYQSVNKDNNSGLAYSAIGGTGRLGAGYLSKESSWGFIGIADLGGITIEGAKTYTFASLETNGIYRTQLGDRGELRQQFGVFYKELPETIGRSTDTITESKKINTIGPHYGVEYWHALSPKLGFQMNMHLYPSIMKAATPNGQDISNSVSYQYGIMGSYRLRKNMTGLVGYAYRYEEAIYKALPGASSAASEGDVNNVLLKGNYLNLFLEWAL